MEIQGSKSPLMTNEFSSVPIDTEVANELAGSKYFKVATAESILRVDAGLRCENAFD